MRPIEFRAKDEITEEWLYFDLLDKNSLQTYIDNLADYKWHSQFTGLLDKNGKKIWEEDILRCNFGEREIGIIKWNIHGFWIEWPSKTLHLPNQEYREVIGSVWENPELLEGME